MSVEGLAEPNHSDTNLWQTAQYVGSLIRRAGLRPTLYIGIANWPWSVWSNNPDWPIQSAKAWRVRELHNTHPNVGVSRTVWQPPMINNWPELIREGLFIAADPSGSRWHLGAYRLSPDYISGLIPLERSPDTICSSSIAQLWLPTEPMPAILQDTLPTGLVAAKKALFDFVKLYNLPSNIADQPVDQG